MKTNDILAFFNIADLRDLPDAVASLLDGDRDTRDSAYRELVRLNGYDFSYDWFQEAYEEELAQLRYELPVYPIKLIYPTCNKTMKEELDVYTQAEQRILIDYILEHPSHVNMSILMALTTGMRIGEVCGITYEDIDFLKHCVSVNKTIYRMVDYSRHDKGVRSSRIVINTPKTRSSQRVIPLSPVVAKWYKKSLDLYGHKSWYVASNAPKATEPRVMREHYKRLLKACSLRYIKFHGLRHTFASTLILNKTDPKTVAALMGHSSVDMTLNVYSHSTDEFKRKAIKSAFKI